MGLNQGTISGCYATGTATGSGYAGGLVGLTSGTISGCYATGDATATDSGYAGGLVGLTSGTISGCYATGDATATDGGYAGGLVGYNNRGTISGSYATGTATGSNAGGLVGYNDGTIIGCYATGTATGAIAGGLVGRQGGTITSSYFDYETSGRAMDEYYAQSTTALQSLTSYTGLYATWNIDIDDGLDPGLEDGTAPGDATADDPWDFGTSSQYPALRIDFDRDGTPSAYEFGEQGREAPVNYDMDNDGLIDITTLEQLDAIRYDLDGDGAVATSDEANYGAAFPATAGGSTYGAIGCGDGTTITACSGYELMENLDFARHGSGLGRRPRFALHLLQIRRSPETGGWLPIGDNSTGGNVSRFTAVFEGNGHTLSNLYIDRSVRFVGLFGILGVGAEVRNVGIEGGSVTTTTSSGNGFAGGLVGHNGGTITSSYATGDATADATGYYDFAGGLVGYNNRGTITSSYATGDAADATGDAARAGGLVGNNDQGTITWQLCDGRCNGRCDRRLRPSRRPGGGEQ